MFHALFSGMLYSMFVNGIRKKKNHIFRYSCHKYILDYISIQTQDDEKTREI